MSRTVARELQYLVFAVLVGTLAFLALPARGQVPDVTYMSPEGSFAPPPAVDFQGLALATAIVTGIVLFARAGVKRVLNPEPSTEFSKALNMALAAVAGLTVGWSGLAGGGSLPERLAFGFVAATMATFGRDIFTRGWRATVEEK